MIAATDFKKMDSATVVYMGLLIIISLLLLRFTYMAFFQSPEIIVRGRIMDIRERKRTDHDAVNNHLITVVTYQYLVSDGKAEYWGECIADYLPGYDEKYSVGDTVIFFSGAKGNNYIIKTPD